MLTWIVSRFFRSKTIGFERFCKECESLVPPMQFSLETPLSTDAVFQIPFTFMHNPAKFMLNNSFS